MHIKNIIKNYINDYNYFISIYDNNIYLFNYEKISHFSNNLIIVKFNNFIIEIEGEKLLINKMLKKELSITGTIKSIKQNYA